MLGRGHRRATARGVASVIDLEDWLRDSGQWWEDGEPQRGDLALFNWDGGVPDHVGIVERRLAGGRFATHRRQHGGRQRLERRGGDAPHPAALVG